MASLTLRLESLWAALRFPSWDRHELEAFQSRRLRALVRHAAERVPFYRELYSRHGVRPEDIRGLEDLPRLPVALRHEMQDRPFEELLARGFAPQKLIQRRTSGSTGYPFTTCRTWFEERLLHALRLGQELRRGLRLTGRRVSLDVGHGDRMDGMGTRLVRRLGLLRRDSVSCLLPAADILARLSQYRPDTLTGYPDALAYVASEAGEEDRRRIRPRFISTGGESLTPDLRARIEERFGAPVHDVYGAHEFNLLAYECSRTGLYHVAEESVLLEVLNNGRPAAPGETGEVVATALHSFAMPFLRYWTGDLAVRGPWRCPCGAPCATLEKIVGRVIDRFVLPDGSKLHPYHLLEPLVKEAPWLRRYQLIQEAANHVVVKLQPLDGVAPRPEDLSRLRACLQAPLGEEVALEFQLVSELPPAGSGKFRPYFSKVRR
jgi:phenylacetate-CoA ligase